MSAGAIDVRDLLLIKKSGKFEVRRGLVGGWDSERTIVWDGRNHLDITNGLPFHKAKQMLNAQADWDFEHAAHTRWRSKARLPQG